MILWHASEYKLHSRGASIKNKYGDKKDERRRMGVERRIREGAE